MKKNEFYKKFANVSVNKRYKIISQSTKSPVKDMTLLDVYKEMEILDYEILRGLGDINKNKKRQEELLFEVEKIFNNKTQ